MSPAQRYWLDRPRAESRPGARRRTHQSTPALTRRDALASFAIAALLVTLAALS